MGLWDYGTMGVMGLWDYGTMGIWGYGAMGLWDYGTMGLWTMDYGIILFLRFSYNYIKI
jgi:hypothetical protein